MKITDMRLIRGTTLLALSLQAALMAAAVVLHLTECAEFAGGRSLSDGRLSHTHGLPLGIWAFVVFCALIPFGRILILGLLMVRHRGPFLWVSMRNSAGKKQDHYFPWREVGGGIAACLSDEAADFGEVMAILKRAQTAKLSLRLEGRPVLTLSWDAAELQTEAARREFAAGLHAALGERLKVEG